MRFLPILILWLLADLYAFQAVTTASAGLDPAVTGLAYWAYWLFDALLLAAISYFISRRGLRGSENPVIHTLFALVVLVLAPKLVTLPFLLFEDIIRTVRAAISGFDAFPERSVWLSRSALIAAALLFLGILYGIWRGRYDYTVRRITLRFPDLPAAFDGFRITQLSDIHSGSFSNPQQVSRGIDLVNAQQSDIILFTGDLVNNRAAEMLPWVEYFARLKAPAGKFSVLGNHDYGDYVRWNSVSEKQANLDQLKGIHRDIGFRLLLNETVALEKDGQKINLIGVENWGARGFAQYGKLNAAIGRIGGGEFNILLSHDPSHWEAQVLDAARPIHLTLSGHTHGMQFGLERLGIRWSPVQYVYKQWAGLYQRAGKYLYVNRGFGYIGFPGRVGIKPEITVITLEKD